MGSRRRFRESDHPTAARALTVGALAVGDVRANAVGPIRLSCERDGLRVELFGVGRFAAGFAFGTLASAVSFRVPYRAVRGMIRNGRSLLLSLDPRVAAPYSRLALVRFSNAPLGALMRAFRVRAAASAVSYVLPFPAAAAAGWEVWRRELVGSLGAAVVAIATAMVVFRLLRGWVGWLSWGGPLSDRLLTAFEQEVSERLGLTPAPELVAGAAAPTPRPPPVADEAIRPTQALGAFARPVAFALVGSLALGAAVASVLTVRRYGVAEEVVLPVADAETGLSEPVRALASAGARDGATQHPSCACARVDSALWREGLPQLSVVVSPVRGQIDAVWLSLGETYAIRHGADDKPLAALDLAIVNNSVATLRSLDLVMTFAFRDEAGQRRNLRERGLHWPGRLGPGETVKWRVEAPGTEVKIETRHDKKLEQVGVAPPEKFYPLSQARVPEVRLHAAMMLAMLGDARAASMVAAAGELDGRAAATREEILRTLSPLALCDIVPREQGGFEACLYNGSDALQRSLTVVATGGEGAPSRHVVNDYFHAGEGLRVTVPLDPKGKLLRVEP